MKGDKNTILGFLILGILFIGFFYYNNKQQKKYLQEEQLKKDSIAALTKVPAPDSAIVAKDSILADSLRTATAAGDFQNTTIDAEATVSIENEVLTAVFSNKGGQLKSVTLKKYKNSVNDRQVVLGGQDNEIDYAVNTLPNQSAQISKLLFAPSAVEKQADGSQHITFIAQSPDGKSIMHQYIVRPNEYLIDWNISMNGANTLLTNNTLQLNWRARLHQQELNGKYEGDQGRISYYNTKKEYDFKRTGSGGNLSFEEPMQWVGFKQQFFSENILSKASPFDAQSSMSMTRVKDTTTHQLFDATANLQLKVPAAATATIPLQLYFGPNDYKVLKAYDNGLYKLVDLGSGIYAFVKPINRFIVIPIFDFLARFIMGYGWVIMLLTIMIRLITSPLMFRSYLSSAKMRALRPELETLKKKFPDQQKYAMEQMKFYREAGVNPMGGCLPAIIQLPIFVALYSFFNSAMQLRGESFLWAKDLSTYDILFRFPFQVPLLGDHISLFTILACITMMVSSIYSMNHMPTTPPSGGSEEGAAQMQAKMMKYMPYLMPIMMLFIFNNQPSALSWYYTVSNIITLLIQFVIMTFIIDHDKILANINEKRKQPKKKSRFQERYATMMEQQQKIQDMKNKGRK